MSKNAIRTASLLGAGVAVGFGVGYYVGFKKAAKEAEIHFEEEVASTKETYQRLAANAQKPPLSSLVDNPEIRAIVEERTEVTIKVDGEELPDFTIEGMHPDEFHRQAEILEKQGYSSAEVAQNIFARKQPSEDELGEEQPSPVYHREPGQPYVISLEEFMEDRQEFDKISLVYFDEDDVLIDERESIIPDVDAVIGTDNLNHFGSGSDSEHSLYIRNEKAEADYEVTRDMRSYVEVVAGMAPERPTKKRPKKQQLED